MKRSLTEWRKGRRFPNARAARWLAGALAAGLPAVTALISFGAPAAPAASSDVDPAAKQFLKASGLYENGRFSQAVEEYQKFLQLYPNHPDATNARYALAVAEYSQEHFDKVVDVLGQVLKDPKFDRRDGALAILGYSQLKLGHSKEAVAAFDELLAKFPKSTNATFAALSRVQALYSDNNYKGASAAAEAFLKQYPQAPERPAAMYYLALSQKSLDQYEQAAATLADLIAKDPKGRYEFDAMLLLGQTLEAQGKLDAAADQYRKLLAAAPAAR